MQFCYWTILLMGNTHVTYFKFRPVVKEGMLLKDFLFLALAAFSFCGTEPLVQFW